jgi:hypothetical protein
VDRPKQIAFVQGWLRCRGDSAVCITRYATDMDRGEEWRKVLDSEVQRWSAMSSEQILSELHDLPTYEVELDSQKYRSKSNSWRIQTNAFTSWWPLMTVAFRHQFHR